MLALLLVLCGLAVAQDTQSEFVRVDASVQNVVDGITGVPLELRVSAFLVGREEVSQQEFERVVGSNPSRFRQADLPVESITWHEALHYCNRRSAMEGLSTCYADDDSWDRTCTGYRLPTEAEWIAALGASEAIPGEVLDAAHLYRGENSVAAIAGLAEQGTRPVGEGALSGAGIRNAFGNVWEWCWDRFHASRIVDAVDNPSGPQTGSERVVRGGSYLTGPRAWNKDFRSSMPMASRSPYLGFRLARSLEEPADTLPARRFPGVVSVGASGPESPADERISGEPEDGEVMEPIEAASIDLLRQQWMAVLGSPDLSQGPVEAVVVEHIEDAVWKGRLLDLYLERELPCRALLMFPAVPPQGRLATVVIPFYDVDTPAGKDLGGRSFMPPGPRALAHLAVQHGMAALVVRWSGENDGPGYLEVVAELARRHPNVTGLGYWVWQSQRLADWLETQPEVDPDRMAIAGHSLGGKMALYAAAFESRFRATVSSEPGISLAFSNYGDPWYLGERIDLLPEGSDQHELLYLIAPRPFLLIGGDSADGTKSLPLLRRAAALYGDSNGLVMLNHASGHSPTPESVSSAIGWLRAQLQNDPGVR